VPSRGAQLVAALLASEECSECGVSLDVFGGEGVLDGENWRCEECASLPGWTR
jgi:hypothetical protein